MRQMRLFVWYSTFVCSLFHCCQEPIEAILQTFQNLVLHLSLPTTQMKKFQSEIPHYCSQIFVPNLFFESSQRSDIYDWSNHQQLPSIHRKTLNPSTQELPQTSMYVSTKSYSAQNYFYHNPRHMYFPQQQQQQPLYTTLVYSKFPAKNLHSVAANCLSLSLSSHIYTRILLNQNSQLTQNCSIVSTYNCNHNQNKENKHSLRSIEPWSLIV
jgi:hypothetical protein